MIVGVGYEVSRYTLAARLKIPILDRHNSLMSDLIMKLTTSRRGIFRLHVRVGLTG
jgi:hypothetical protein